MGVRRRTSVEPRPLAGEEVIEPVDHGVGDALRDGVVVVEDLLQLRFTVTELALAELRLEVGDLELIAVGHGHAPRRILARHPGVNAPARRVRPVRGREPARRAHIGLSA